MFFKTVYSKRKSSTKAVHKKLHFCGDVIRCHGDDNVPILFCKKLRVVKKKGMLTPSNIKIVQSNKAHCAHSNGI